MLITNSILLFLHIYFINVSLFFYMPAKRVSLTNCTNAIKFNTEPYASFSVFINIYRFLFSRWVSLSVNIHVNMVRFWNMLITRITDKNITKGIFVWYYQLCINNLLSHVGTILETYHNIF